MCKKTGAHMTVKSFEVSSWWYWWEHLCSFPGKSEGIVCCCCFLRFLFGFLVNYISLGLLSTQVSPRDDLEPQLLRWLKGWNKTVLVCSSIFLEHRSNEGHTKIWSGESFWRRAFKLIWPFRWGFSLDQLSELIQPSLTNWLEMLFFIRITESSKRPCLQ